MNYSNEDLEKLENELQTIKLANEVNKNAITTLKNQLFLAQSTKAWKIMCLLRRINEQFIKGSKIERKKFVSWFISKVFKKPISIEYSLSKYSPILHESIEICEVQESHNTTEKVSYNSFVELQGDYINFKVKSYDLFRFPIINWNFRWQRPQQISSQFADNGHRVFYFSVDILPLEDGHLRYEDVSKKVLIEEVRSNVWVIKICSKNPINIYSNSIMDEKDLLYLDWSIQYVKEKFNIGYSVSIVDLPFWKPLVTEIDNNKVIYDCMDEHEGFSTNSNEMLSDEHKLMNLADMVIASSNRLYEKIKLSTDNVLLIRNAGEYRHFSSVDNSLIDKTDSLKSNKIIGYYGAISEWFDIDLIYFLAKRHPEWSFVLIGDTFGCDTTKVSGLQNVSFLGEKPYDELPKYLNVFDVAIIPFIKNNLTLATNPVKVYEYLAAGKAVVSTDLPELRLMSEYLYLASSHEEFEIAILNALNNDDVELVERRKRYASENTWENRYSVLTREITSRFFPKVSVVIVTYNNWSFTKQCLNSLFLTNDYPNLEVIVVDNMSTDETRIELSRIMHPQLKVILSPVNTGFAGGNSIGCKASSGDYIILLNNDTILSPGWIHRLISPLRERNDIGMTGPVSNSVGNDQALDFFVGDPIQGPDKLWLLEFYRMYKHQYYETELLGFYCVAIKREVYEKVGDLDTNYGIGMFEDDDYCERVKALGYKLVVVKDAFVYHHGSASFKKVESSTYTEIWEKNRAFFEKKWNKKWKQPQNPRSIFLNCNDCQSINKVFTTVNKEKTMILGNKNWNSRSSAHDWEQIAIKNADQGQLIIVYVHFYNSSPVIGVRKLSENIYLTSRIELFTDSLFDNVIYCGETMYHELKSKNYIIYSRTYNDQSFYNEFKKKNNLKEITETSQLVMLFQ